MINQSRTVTPRLSPPTPQLTAPNGRFYPTNKLSSTKYNTINVIPYTFLLQFSKLANVYVLGNVILQCIPSISTNSAFAAGVPLLFMVMIGMIKEILADLKRHQNDKIQNGLLLKRLLSSGSGTVEEVDIRSDQISVGDIIRIYDDQTIPADCAILASYSMADRRASLRLRSSIRQTSEVE